MKIIINTNPQTVLNNVPLLKPEVGETFVYDGVRYEVRDIKERTLVEVGPGTFDWSNYELTVYPMPNNQQPPVPARYRNKRA